MERGQKASACRLLSSRRFRRSRQAANDEMVCGRVALAGIIVDVRLPQQKCLTVAFGAVVISVPNSRSAFDRDIPYFSRRARVAKTPRFVLVCARFDRGVGGGDSLAVVDGISVDFSFFDLSWLMR